MATITVMDKVVVRVGRPLDHIYDPCYAQGTISGAGGRGRHAEAASTTAGHFNFHHHRPRVPRLGLEPANLVLALNQAPSDAEEAREARQEPARVVDREVQTVFRESEAQTLAYSPEVALPTNVTVPETLVLKDLSVATGSFPLDTVGLKAVELALARHRLEEALPPTTDNCSSVIRLKLLNTAERVEFLRREQIIDKEHAVRLEALRVTLQERCAREEKNREVRAGQYRDQAKIEQTAQRLAKTRLAALRRLRKKRQNAVPPLRNSVDALAPMVQLLHDPTSVKFAPRRRDGAQRQTLDRVKVKGLEVLLEPTEFGPLSSQANPEEGGDQLILDLRKCGPTVSVHQPRVAQATELQSIRNHALMADTLFSDTKAQARNQHPGTTTVASEVSSSHRHLSKTPTTEKAETTVEEDAGCSQQENPRRRDEEKQYAAICLLQCLLRGRAGQNLMVTAKEARLDLIKELRMSNRANTVTGGRDRTSNPTVSAHAGPSSSQLGSGRFDQITMDMIIGTQVSEVLQKRSKVE